VFDLKRITEALINGDGEKLTELVQRALDSNVSAKEILHNALIAGMDIIGEKMEIGDMFIPEVLMSAQAMKQSLGVLKPLLSEEDSAGVGKVVIGTVKGDIHDIGKNLVSMMLEATGFKVFDMGVDVDPGVFVEVVRANRPNIVALSALLTTTMPMMRQTIKEIEESGLRTSVKIIVGGAPVSQSFADEIGADGYAADAGSASKLAKSILQ
jgi:5-methyltetrahydrofolate--homocysteine methyltransferase